MNATPAREPFLILTGPTAVGKTSVSLELAEERNAEIVSADSRQIYRALTIGTAKPEPEELARVRHHFIDELDLHTPFSAGTFAREANERIRNILTRGRTPLVVGGSTLYIHALQTGFAEVPPVDPEIRTELEQRLDEEGSLALFEELNRLDPAFAATLDHTKSQRLIRGLEVYYGTGQTLTSFHREQQPPPFTFKVVVLQRDRTELYERINRRVDDMIARGLLREVQAILDAGVDPALNPLRTIGYREAIAHLQGTIPFDEMVRLIKRNSRRYAKRQLTWFRRFPEFFCIAITELEDGLRTF